MVTFVVGLEGLKSFFSGFGHEDLMKFISTPIPKMIPALEIDLPDNRSFKITNDPVYIAGMGTFTLSKANPHTFEWKRGSDQKFRGVVYFINHPGVSVALLLNNARSMHYFSVERPQILASTLLFLTRTDILHTRIYPFNHEGFILLDLLKQIRVKAIDALPNYTPILGSFKVPRANAWLFPKPHLDFIEINNRREEGYQGIITELYTDYRDVTGRSLFERFKLI